MAEDITTADTGTTSTTEAAKTTLGKFKDHASNLVGEAGDAARNAANEGMGKATEALSSLSQVVEDAATMVEEKVGPTYGNYARKAATTVSNVAEGLKNKDVDALIEDTREFVRKSPMVAIGAAAAIGFVLTRLVKLGTGTDTGTGKTDA